MQRLSDERLVALLDGELAGDEAAEVERFLAQSLERRRDFEALAAVTVQLRHAFDAVLHESVPAHLIAVARGSAHDAPDAGALAAAAGPVSHPTRMPARDDAELARHRTSRRLPGARRWVPISLAASVGGMLIGAGGTYWGSRVETGKEPANQAITASTGSLLDNLAGYYKLLHGGATEAAYDIPGEGTGAPQKAPPRGQTEFKVPDLKPWGLSFQGARLIVVEGKPAEQLSYKTNNTVLGPLTVVMFASKRPDVVPRIEERQGVNLMYWRHAGKAVAIVGTFDKNYMWKLANDVGFQLGAL